MQNKTNEFPRAQICPNIMMYEKSKIDRKRTNNVSNSKLAHLGGVSIKLLGVELKPIVRTRYMRSYDEESDAYVGIE